jgi:hypothetical protein
LKRQPLPKKKVESGDALAMAKKLRRANREMRNPFSYLPLGWAQLAEQLLALQVLTLVQLMFDSFP